MVGRTIFARGVLDRVEQDFARAGSRHRPDAHRVALSPDGEGRSAGRASGIESRRAGTPAGDYAFIFTGSELRLGEEYGVRGIDPGPGPDEPDAAESCDGRVR